MRQNLTKHLDHDPDFEWRGQNVTRIENLSDIVFALALGMLLLTGTPPQTYGQLLTFLTNIIPVTAGFAILFMIWNAHFVFFRRYGLADNKIVFLNSILLLAVLFVAYPLRFIFDSLFGYIIGSMTGDWARLMDADMDFRNSAKSMAIFASGYAAIYLVISMMYAHALTKHNMIGLSSRERALTKQSLWQFRGEVLIALTVAFFAFFTPLGPFAGALMGLNWPAAYLVARLEKVPDDAEAVSAA